MEAKYTKGEWTYYPNEEGDYTLASSIEEENDTILGFCIEDEDAKLLSASKELLEALVKILNISEDSGREGCNYGDTEYDSISAAYGYNLCLNQIKDMITPIVKKATE